MRMRGWNAGRALSLLLPLSLLSLGHGAFAEDGREVRVKKAVVRTDPTPVAFLGVEIEEEADGGARITHVVPDSAASRAGLEEGDVVVRFDGEAVHGPAGLTHKVRERDAGDEVQVVVLREGQEETLSVELGSRERQVRVLKLEGFDAEDLANLEDLDVDVDIEAIEEALEGIDIDLEGLAESLEDLDVDVDIEAIEDALEGIDVESLPRNVHGHRVKIVCKDGDCERHVGSALHRPLLGVHLVETTPELNVHLGGAERPGLLISGIVEGSAAEDAGIRVGDLIVSVGGQEISQLREIRQALRGKAGESVRIEVVRDGAAKAIEVELQGREREAED